MASAERAKNRKKLCYRLRVCIGTKDNGDPIQKEKIWTPPAGMTERQAYKQALIEADKLEMLLKRGINTDKITFEKLSELYIDDIKQTQKLRTITSHRDRLKRINATLGHLDVKDITPRHIQNFLKELSKPQVRRNGEEKPLANASIKGYKRTISCILTFGTQEGYITDNVCLGKKIKLPKVDDGKEKMIEPEVINAYLSALDTAPAKHRAFFRILIDTGMRLGEIQGLRWSDIDFDRNIVTIVEESSYAPEYGVFFTTTKNETSQRAVTLSPQMASALKEWKAVQAQEKLEAGYLWLRNPENPKEEYCENHSLCEKKSECYCSKHCKNFKQSDRIFTGELGKPLSHSAMRQYIQKVGKRYDLPHVTIHMFRHAVVSLLIDSGEPLPAISKFVGHASTATTTRVYSHAVSKTANRLQNTIADCLERAK